MRYLPILILIFTSCGGAKHTQSTYVVPAPEVITKDSFITIFIEKLIKDSIDCKEIIFDNATLVQRLSDCQKVNSELNILISQKPTKVKIKNSYNETNKLNNSILVRDSAIASLQAENMLLNSKLKATKGSAVGDGNKITIKKSNWWWIFVAGMLTMFIGQNVVWKGIKRYIAFV